MNINSLGKTLGWLMIACRIPAVAFGLIFLIGCGGKTEDVSTGARSEAEVEWDNTTQNAMEAASENP